MNLGFAAVESGFARSKNTVNILSKNFIVFAVSSLGFMLLGWGLMSAETIRLSAQRNCLSWVVPISASTKTLDVDRTLSGENSSSSLFSVVLQQPCIRCSGRTYKIYILYSIFFHTDPLYLPCRRSLDMGRRLAGQPWFMDLRRHRCSLCRRLGGSDRSYYTWTPSRKIWQRRKAKGNSRP